MAFAAVAATASDVNIMPIKMPFAHALQNQAKISHLLLHSISYYNPYVGRLAIRLPPAIHLNCKRCNFLLVFFRSDFLPAADTYKTFFFNARSVCTFLPLFLNVFCWRYDTTLIAMYCTHSFHLKTEASKDMHAHK